MKQIKYFPGFNSFRFVSAFLIIATHTELARAKFSLFNLLNWPVVNEGSFAVECFFVLSGFLITYLLLKESDKTGTINIKHFYIRRILRIWPLYYFIVILGLIIIPLIIKYVGVPLEVKIPLYPSIVFYILMLPNLVSILFGSSFLSPLWTIGVEEQFYLIWAPVFKYVKKYFIHFLVVIIIIRMIYIFLVMPVLLNSGSESNTHIANFFLTIKFECMAVGALGAVLLFSDKFSKVSGVIFSYWIQVLTFLVFIAMFWLHVYKVNALPLVDNTVIHAIFIQIFLFNISLNPKSLVKLNNRFFSYLGEISYGIYMYHSIVIFSVMYVLKDFLKNLHPVLATLITYSSVFAVVITIAHFSFHFFEKPINSHKNRLNTSQETERASGK